MALAKTARLSKELISYLCLGFNPSARHITAQGDFLMSVARQKDCTKIVVVVEELPHKWSRVVSELVLAQRKGIFPIEFVTCSALQACDVSGAAVVSFDVLDQGVRDTAGVALEITDKLDTDDKALFSGRFLETGKYIALYDREVSQALRSSHNSDLKIQAIVTCYNEQDIIGHTIHYLVDQGIHVHIIDNWSTDDSSTVIEQLVREHEIVTSEKFPEDGPSKTYDWEQILTHVQNHAMAHHSAFDWFIHHDADEVRESPFQSAPGLAEGLRVVNELGYNAIDHTVINFHIEDENALFSPHDDPTTFFTNYTIGRGEGYKYQIKAWKSHEKIDVATTGGHEVIFSPRKVFPYRFLLRHYPLRSITQATKKIFKDRKSRWQEKERSKNWHKQYDNIDTVSAIMSKGKGSKIYDRKMLYDEELVYAISKCQKVSDK